LHVRRGQVGRLVRASFRAVVTLRILPACLQRIHERLTAVQAAMTIVTLEGSNGARGPAPACLLPPPPPSSPRFFLPFDVQGPGLRRSAGARRALSQRWGRGRGGHRGRGAGAGDDGVRGGRDAVLRGDGARQSTSSMVSPASFSKAHRMPILSGVVPWTGTLRRSRRPCRLRRLRCSSRGGVGRQRQRRGRSERPRGAMRRGWDARRGPASICPGNFAFLLS